MWVCLWMGSVGCFFQLVWCVGAVPFIAAVDSWLMLSCPGMQSHIKQPAEVQRQCHVTTLDVLIGSPTLC